MIFPAVTINHSATKQERLEELRALHRRIEEPSGPCASCAGLRKDLEDVTQERDRADRGWVEERERLARQRKQFRQFASRHGIEWKETEP